MSDEPEIEEAKIYLEHAIKKIDASKEIRKEIYLDHISLIEKSIRELRNWVLQLSLLSSAIIGISIPALNNFTLIKSTNFFVIGLIALLLLVIFGFTWVKTVLEKEIDDLYKGMRNYFDLLDKSIAADQKFIDCVTKGPKNLASCKEKWESTLKALAKPWQDKIEEDKKRKLALDHTTDLLMIQFVLGISVLMASILFSV